MVKVIGRSLRKTIGATRQYEKGDISAYAYASERARLLGTPSLFYFLILPSFEMLRERRMRSRARGKKVVSGA